jgi:ABC-type Zn uptake system ZnuABC Zn-binding protein ZnuA
MLFISNNVFASTPKILVGSKQVASIVKMITKDNAEIISIANNDTCPEHYHIKPSDITKAQNANLVIYIDDKFEPFIAHILHKSDVQNILKISNIPNLKIRNNNMHIWLDLDNVELICHELHKKLVSLNPEKENLWNKNLRQAKKELSDLRSYKEDKIKDLGSTILLSDSLEYLLEPDNNIEKFYIHSSMVSMKTISKLDKIDNKKCILADSSLTLKDLDKDIVKIDSEKWSDDYTNHYKKIIDSIANNCQQK